MDYERDGAMVETLIFPDTMETTALTTVTPLVLIWEIMGMQSIFNSRYFVMNLNSRKGYGLKGGNITGLHGLSGINI